MGGSPAPVNDGEWWWSVICGPKARSLQATDHRSPFSNQPGSKAIPEERVSPLDKNAQPIAKTGEIQNVQEEPEPPCRVPGDVHAVTEVGDRFVAAYRRQLTLVPVAKWAPRLATNRVQDVARGSPSALDRALRNARNRFAIGRHHGEIADHENLGTIRHTEIGLHDDAARAVRRNPWAKQPAERRGGVSRGP